MRIQSLLALVPTKILLALLILSVLIFIHELGHFLAAKMFKIPVSEFALGMGPKVLSIKGKNTTYSLRLIPVGGFVNIEGMEIEPEEEVENGFNSKHPLKRFVVLFAGVFMNFLLAFMIIFVSVKISGAYSASNEPVIGIIGEESAGKGVLIPKDKILKIDNIEITQWSDIIDAVNKNSENIDTKELEISVNRNGEIKNFKMKLKKNLENNRFMIGIGPEVYLDKSTKRVFQENKEIYSMMLNGLKMLFTGRVKSSEISGPIGIIKAVGEFSQKGLGPLTFLAALLSINLGLLNLLPFPALDGGRIVFVIFEFLKIKINKKVEEKLHFAGMIVLFSLIFLITINDVLKIFKR
ncbi:M50 family metallopeptidase [Fusobacterium sp. PH5-44]|uniref:M50 family metallopeptidase n=1 Tax=unclassified Fusobacterium TaxID=2648384 RepID=UPI003D1BCAD9